MQKVKIKKTLLLTTKEGEVRELTKKDFHSFNAAENSPPSTLLEKLSLVKAQKSLIKIN